jgi:hypothetical protein
MLIIARARTAPLTTVPTALRLSAAQCRSAGISLIICSAVAYPVPLTMQKGEDVESTALHRSRCCNVAFDVSGVPSLFSK